jgi:hypothetical protein
MVPWQWDCWMQTAKIEEGQFARQVKRTLSQGVSGG